MLPVRVTLKVAFPAATFSATDTSLIARLTASSSVMVPVPRAVVMDFVEAVDTRFESVTWYVSVGSAIASPV